MTRITQPKIDLQSLKPFLYLGRTLQKYDIFGSSCISEVFFSPAASLSEIIRNNM